MSRGPFKGIATGEQLWNLAKVKEFITGGPNDATAACAHLYAQLLGNFATGAGLPFHRFLSDVTRSGVLPPLVSCVSRGGFCGMLAALALDQTILGDGPSGTAPHPPAVEGAADALVSAGALPALVQCLKRAAEVKGADRVPSILCAGDTSLLALSAFMAHGSRFKAALLESGAIGPFVERLARFREPEPASRLGQRWKLETDASLPSRLSGILEGMSFLCRPVGSRCPDRAAVAAFGGAGATPVLIRMLAETSASEQDLALIAKASTLLTYIVDIEPPGALRAPLSASPPALRGLLKVPYWGLAG